MKRSHLLLPLLIVNLACAGSKNTIHRDGFQLEADAMREAEESLTRRAAFDLNCEAHKLSLVVLAVEDDAGPDVPRSVGVNGCGKRATYVRMFVNGRPLEWGMNSSSEEQSK